MKLKVNFRNAIGRLIEGIKLKHSRNHQQTYLLNLNKFPFHPPLGPKFFFLFFFLGPNKKVWASPEPTNVSSSPMWNYVQKASSFGCNVFFTSILWCCHTNNHPQGV